MKAKLFFAWYDLWIGVYWDRKGRRLYILPLPCIGLMIQFQPVFPYPKMGRVEDYQRALDAAGMERRRHHKHTALIESLEKLPNEWRTISYKTTEEYTNLHGCADQLEALLDRFRGD